MPSSPLIGVLQDPHRSPQKQYTARAGDPDARRSYLAAPSPVAAGAPRYRRSSLVDNPLLDLTNLRLDRVGPQMDVEDFETAASERSTRSS